MFIFITIRQSIVTHIGHVTPSIVMYMKLVANTIVSLIMFYLNMMDYLIFSLMFFT